MPEAIRTFHPASAALFEDIVIKSFGLWVWGSRFGMQITESLGKQA